MLLFRCTCQDIMRHNSKSFVILNKRNISSLKLHQSDPSQSQDRAPVKRYQSVCSGE
jgi:hypothetical protein